MSSKEAEKEFVVKAWNVVFTADRSAISEFYTEDAIIEGYTPPKQTSWSGLDAIVAHFKEIAPVVSCKSFNISNIDLVRDSETLYVTWDAEFALTIPGAPESVMPGAGIAHIQRRDGKVTRWIQYEDPTPFVAMALKGQMGASA